MESNNTAQNTETKVCNRCGKEKPISEFYMVKYKNKKPKYSYGTCKTCTSIEQRRRYLQDVDPTNPLLEKIEALYDKHRAAGRSVPDTARRRGNQLEEEIDAMLGE